MESVPQIMNRLLGSIKSTAIHREIERLGYIGLTYGTFRDHWFDKFSSTKIREDELIIVLRALHNFEICSIKDAFDVISQLNLSESQLKVVFEGIAHLFNRGEVDKIQILYSTYLNKGGEYGINEKKYIPLHKLSMSTNNIDLGQLIGIDGLVQRIVKIITRENGSRFISVEGQGGIGKTSIAYAVTEQIRRDTNFKAVLWISVGSYLSLATFEIENQGYESILSQIAKIFTLPDEASVLNLLESEPYLVVIDNIETKQETEGGLLDGLVSLKQGKSRFLITSRFAIRSSFPFINSIELKELSTHNVKMFLENLFEGKEKITTQKATRVKAITGGIPLVIYILARLARATNLNSVLDIIQQLQVDIEDKYEKLSIAFNYIYGTIWQNHLEPTTKRLLVRLASQMPIDGFAIEWLESATGIHNNDLAYYLENAMDYYLITKTESEDGDLLFMHPLTQSYIKLVQIKK